MISGFILFHKTLKFQNLLRIYCRSNRWRRVDFSLPVGIAYPSAEVHKGNLYKQMDVVNFGRLILISNVGTLMLDPSIKVVLAGYILYTIWYQRGINLILRSA